MDYIFNEYRKYYWKENSLDSKLNKKRTHTYFYGNCAINFITGTNERNFFFCFMMEIMLKKQTEQTTKMIRCNFKQVSLVLLKCQIFKKLIVKHSVYRYYLFVHFFLLVNSFLY